MNRTAILLVSSLLALVALGGCSSDCNLACAEAAACFQIAPGPAGDPAAASNIDVCTNLCENAIDDDVISEGDAEDCATCLESASCSEINADGDCATECQGIPGVDLSA